jgi:hypothetical protein
MGTDYILSSLRLARPSSETDSHLVSEPSPSSAVCEGGELGCGLPNPQGFYHTPGFSPRPVMYYYGTLVLEALRGFPQFEDLAAILLLGGYISRRFTLFSLLGILRT